MDNLERPGQVDINARARGELVAACRAYGINMSRVVRRALAEEVRRAQAAEPKPLLTRALSVTPAPRPKRGRG